MQTSGAGTGAGLRVRKAIPLVLLAVAVRSACAQAGVTPVPQLDLRQLQGKWYEIARMPEKSEKKCYRDALTLYTLRNKAGQFRVVQSCLLEDGTANTRNFGGKVQDKSGDGKLKVTYTWPFRHRYWVLGLGPGYSWALVGGPDHKTLWLLSRTASLAPEAVAEMKAKAQSEGFDTAKLVSTPVGGARETQAR